MIADNKKVIDQDGNGSQSAETTTEPNLATPLGCINGIETPITVLPDLEVSACCTESADLERPVTVAPSSSAKVTSELHSVNTNIQSSQSNDLLGLRGPTGPRTEVGKKSSSRNATKFGIFSRATLLTGESRAEYQSLLDGLWETYKPIGKQEELLVEKLASNSWRYRRLLVAEGAEIRKSSEFLAIDRSWKSRKDAERISQARESGAVDMFTLVPVGLVWNIENPNVLVRCLELLSELRERIQNDGFDQKRDSAQLEELYGEPSRVHFRPTLHKEYSGWLEIAKMGEKERAIKRYPTREECQKGVVLAINAEINRLEQLQQKRELIESQRTQLEILGNGIPDSRGMDRILKYETTLERALDRTLHQLERLQRIRKGQLVLPPIEVDISL